MPATAKAAQPAPDPAATVIAEALEKGGLPAIRQHHVLVLLITRASGLTVEVYGNQNRADGRIEQLKKQRSVKFEVQRQPVIR